MWNSKETIISDTFSNTVATENNDYETHSIDDCRQRHDWPK